MLRGSQQERLWNEVLCRRTQAIRECNTRALSLSSHPQHVGGRHHLSPPLRLCVPRHNGQLAQGRG
eukprot:scaffold14488_cov131-Isochrysis_galbana.AAC.10